MVLVWVPEILARKFRNDWLSCTVTISIEVTGRYGRSIEVDQASSLKDAIQDCGGDVFIVEDLPNSLTGLLVVNIIGRLGRS